MTSLLRLLIVDDEPPARARTRRLLAGIPGVKIAGEAGSAAEARVQIAERSPDLLLLDIQMPGEDGFALLRSLEPRPAVVFVTAYDQYAVRAFEENAVDYLLKPFRRERLEEALARARADLERPEELSRRLTELLGSLGPGVPMERLERFTVRSGNPPPIPPADEVLWVGPGDKLVFAPPPEPKHDGNITLDETGPPLDPRP